MTYGWGMIPVTVRLGGTEWTTSLWPKDGRYVVPLKDWVRAAEGVELGDEVTIRLTVDVCTRRHRHPPARLSPFHRAARCPADREVDE